MKLQEKCDIILLKKKKKQKYKSEHEFLIHLVNDNDGKIGVVFSFSGQMMGYCKGYGTLNKALQFLQTAGRCFGNYFSCGNGVFIQDDREKKSTMYCLSSERTQDPIRLVEVDYIKFHKRINGKNLQ